MWFVWVLAAVGLFLFAQWLNTFLKQNFNLPPDMQMLIVLAFTGILGILMFASLWDWHSDSLRLAKQPRILRLTYKPLPHLKPTPLPSLNRKPILILLIYGNPCCNNYQGSRKAPSFR
jgi:hypothetical protein